MLVRRLRGRPRGSSSPGQAPPSTRCPPSPCFSERWREACSTSGRRISRHLSLKQGEGGHLVLGGAWPGELDAQGRPRNLRDSIEGNLWVARSVLPALDGLHVIRAWTGINVLVPGPILGADPRVPGLFHAVTFNGWTLAPVIAELIVEQLRGGSGPPKVFAPASYAFS